MVVVPFVQKLDFLAHCTVSKRAPVLYSRLAQTCEEQHILRRVGHMATCLHKPHRDRLIAGCELLRELRDEQAMQLLVRVRAHQRRDQCAGTRARDDLG